MVHSHAVHLPRGALLTPRTMCGTGRDCSIVCPNRCSHHGTCSSGACECDAGWSGDDCSTERPLQQIRATLLSISMPSWSELSPLSSMLFASLCVFTAFCGLGYVVNLCSGLRGTAAVPLYRYLSASYSYSDYQLKQ